ncbi:MAG: ribonuclease R [Bacteroidetes bacterium]|jgi:ribonuclease R|nr:ribonuclease R [Bacteroidota bacterium]MBK7139016.1 ribonuclease R [Bacteroidota bacterium]MBK7640270.1 ribonuclease R [Bacteroidota bacterium]MBL0077642.1 ribonuclease R [Bacteroidota bacterium]MBL0286464.1 ribonuclease R [Bacteroidota bacterium]
MNKRKGKGGSVRPPQKNSAAKETILAFLKKNGGELFTQMQIIEKFQKMIPAPVLRITLEELLNKGQVEITSKGKYYLSVKGSDTQKTKEPLIGRVDMSKSGVAYITVDGFDKDFVVRPGNTGHALDGDMVEIQKMDRRGGSKPEAKILNVRERKREYFVCQMQVTANHIFAVTTDPNVHVDFYIEKKKSKNAQNGEKVVVRMTEWAKTSRNPMGEVVELLGSNGENDLEMKSILINHGFPISFPNEVIDEVNNLPTKIAESEIEKRRDFREICTFTIDPADAKDFDDALSFQKLENGNYEVGVHIADVSHYVKEDSAMDKEAFKRATSVYLVDRVNPMFPELLSNIICSLRPKEEKLCFSAVFELDENANVKKEWFGRTVIFSQKRFSYEEAQDVLENKMESPFKEELFKLNDLAKKLKAKRFIEGSISFETKEVKFKLDANSKPIGIFVKERKDSNMLIEDFMLLANKHVAQFLGKNNIQFPSVYRIHDVPDEEKLMDFQMFAKQFGYNVRFNNPKQISDELNKLMAEIQGKPEQGLLENLAIRCMAKAVYSTNNIGHYGLGFEDYTHFTSPIRRMPDVMVHRLLHAVLEKQKIINPHLIELKCKHSSEREKAAAESERESVKYKMCEYMLEHKGMELDGVISGVKSWGFYVEVPTLNCEGLVRKDSLRDDNYDFDEKKMLYKGQFNDKIYQLGNPVRIKVDNVDMNNKTIDFVLVK